MSLLKLTGGCLLAGALVVVVFQKSATSRARQENHDMRQVREEAARLEQENRSIAELRRGSFIGFRASARWFGA